MLVIILTDAAGITTHSPVSGWTYEMDVTIGAVCGNICPVQIVHEERRGAYLCGVGVNQGWQISILVVNVF